MPRIFITGSSDGLGLAVAQRLVQRGHSVVLHGRNAQRARDAASASPGAESVVTGDLSSLKEIQKLAEDVNKLGTFDCIIHNAGLYRGPFSKTEDGIAALVAVNTIAPYVLANLISKPKRLIFLSSEMHQSGDANLSDPLFLSRGEESWDENTAYCDSKLHNVVFAKAFARRWKDVTVSSLDPGWVATKMGGPGASGDIEKAIATYVMLAEGEEKVETGRHWMPGKREDRCKKGCERKEVQDRLLEACGERSGVSVQS